MRVLHVLAGDDAVRNERIARIWEGRQGFRHAVAAEGTPEPKLAQSIAVPPLPLGGRPSVARYQAIGGRLVEHDLVLTYGDAALDVLVARRIFTRGLPPTVHHRDADNEVSATAQRLFRRFLLPAASAVAVAGLRGELVDGGLPPHTTIAPQRKRGEFVIGASMSGDAAGMAHLQAAARALPNGKLIIIGEGQGYRSVRAVAAHLDLFVLTGGTDHFPLLDAMAAGLPVTGFTPFAEVLPEAARPFLTADPRDPDLVHKLLALAGSSDRRGVLGEANRARAAERYDGERMRRAYVDLYARATETDPVDWE